MVKFWGIFSSSRGNRELLVKGLPNSSIIVEASDTPVLWITPHLGIKARSILVNLWRYTCCTSKLSISGQLRRKLRRCRSLVRWARQMNEWKSRTGFFSWMHSAKFPKASVLSKILLTFTFRHIKMLELKYPWETRLVKHETQNLKYLWGMGRVM